MWQGTTVCISVLPFKKKKNMPFHLYLYKNSKISLRPAFSLWHLIEKAVASLLVCFLNFHRLLFKNTQTNTAPPGEGVLFLYDLGFGLCRAPGGMRISAGSDFVGIGAIVCAVVLKSTVAYSVSLTGGGLCLPLLAICLGCTTWISA